MDAKLDGEVEWRYPSTFPSALTQHPLKLFYALIHACTWLGVVIFHVEPHWHIDSRSFFAGDLGL
jgi:hypothetical protein